MKYTNTKNTVCLVIIFNHKYEDNLPILREIYGSRFSCIRFLMPFYEGKDKDVISVYESSYQFQGYIAQAREKLLELNCRYYFFIGDDLILNPVINEHNFMNELRMKDGDAMISPYHALQDKTEWTLERIYDAIRCFENTAAVLYKNELLSRDEALSKSMKKNNGGIYRKKLVLKNKYKLEFIKKHGIREFLRIFMMKNMPYPLWGGYSDWFIMPREDLEIVSMKFGVTAAMGLFVEIAVPTVMFYYCKKLGIFISPEYHGGAIWSPDELTGLEKKYQRNIDNLLQDFPKDKLYLHPIKLSLWKNDDKTRL